MEKNVLYKNKNLEQIFTQAEYLYAEPLVISQVSFAHKEQVAGNMLLCGDSAGLITPLCGNGMSMALEASSIAAPLADLFLRGDISRKEMQSQYKTKWNNNFSKRLKLGRTVQAMFGNNLVTSAFLQSCKIIPPLADFLIRQSHGQPFS